MKQVYIASPFRGDYAKNIRDVVEYCRMAGECGVLPLAPHLIFGQWCDDTIPEQRERGRELGLALLKRSDELWVMGTATSEGMRAEIAFAGGHGIPTFYILHPMEKESYPVSGDGNPLLSLMDCVDKSQEEDYEGELVVLRHENLTPGYRTPRNQLWIATHGPGCQPDWKYSATIHLRHPLDGDCMALTRNGVWGRAKPEVLGRLGAMYPKFAGWLGAQGKDSPYPTNPYQTALQGGEDEEFSR